MSWAFIEYPWQALLHNRLKWSVIPEYIRPDNGAGILFVDEKVELPSSLRVLNQELASSCCYVEIAGPSLREDGFSDFSMKFSQETEERIIEYKDVSCSNSHEPAAQFHDSLTNSVQEFSSILFEKRKELHDKFYEKPLYEILEEYFLQEDEDFAIRSLICEIADEIPPVISAVVNQPRKILQRKHAQVGLDRLQEMDMRSLIDYARRPGDTAVLKGGDRQTLMAVIREETTDTLENRVLKDFCKRAREVAELYIEECCSRCSKTNCDKLSFNIQSHCCSKRVKSVESFVRRCEQWLSAPNLNEVASLVVPCRIPNYALLQNVRYVRIWDYYQRLLNQEDVRDQTWQWKRQTWSDYVRILMMQTMSLLMLNGSPPAFKASRKPSRLYMNPLYGKWFKVEPFDGPIVFENKNEFVSVYLLNKADVDCLFDNIGKPLASLNADLYCVAVSTDWIELRVVPIWALVGDSRWHCEGNEILRNKCLSDVKEACSVWECRASVSGKENIVKLVKAVVVKSDYSKSKQYENGNVVFLEVSVKKDALDFSNQINAIFREVLL